ncbi:trypsin-like peptidase domain-containing protein [Nonomuraea sp. NPDC049269]|uniref:nSTAND1 domain-containing NTPase n=1 Tax=Nonomuraea sp. NPDC049269 TaxID=3364349 RepID=UPI003717F701
MGFIAGSRHLVTCAHVVNAALKREARDRSSPGQPWLQVEFPFAGEVGDRIVRRARVESWLPREDVPFEILDVAGLRLDEQLPSGAEPATLASRQQAGETLRRVQFWGPGIKTVRGGQREGHVTGESLGRTDRARLQVNQELDGVFRAGPGFSGGPVWEKTTGQVVGIIQAVPTNSDAIDIYVIDGDLLVEAWPDVLYRPPPCPYKGLAAFTADDTEHFFGREEFTEQLIGAAQSEPVITVFGPSGSGKSSVIAAGLVPALQSHDGLAVATFKPGSHPILNLAGSLAGLTRHNATASLSELDRWTEVLHHGGMAGAYEIITAATGAPRLLIVADQFEQLFTDCVALDRQASLLNLLQALVHDCPDGLQVAITIRTDFFGELCAADDPLGSYIQATAHALRPMTDYQLKRAIIRPAEVVGGNKPTQFDDGLVDLICDHFRGQPAELPLLEFTLTRLWELQHSRVLSLKAYRDLGGVAATLASYADDVVGNLNPAQYDAARRIFTELVQPTRKDIARQARQGDLRPADWSTVELLRDQRLLAISRPTDGSGNHIVEVAHEALLRTWQRLHDWLSASEVFSEWKARTIVARDVWERYDRDSELLLRGPLLTQAMQMARKYPEDVLGLHDFINASRIEARAGQRRPNLTVRHAISLRLAHRSEIMLREQRNDPTIAIVLAIHSVLQLPTWQGHQALRQATRGLGTHEGGAAWQGLIREIVFSPHGTHLIKISTDPGKPQWEIVVGTGPSRLMHDDAVYAVAFSPDGYHLASFTSRAANIWDLNTGNLTICLGQDGSDGWNDFSFSPDGTKLAIAGADRTARIWAVSAGIEISQFVHEDEVKDVAFSPDGTSLATASGHTARVWDTGTGSVTAVYDHGSDIHGVAFSQDGEHIATIANHILHIWSALTGQGIVRISNGEEIFRAYFSPDGSCIATLSEHVVRVWQVGTGVELVNFLHEEKVFDVDFSPNGTYLATVSGSIVHIWDFATGLETTRIALDGAALGVTFSPDGSYLATAGADHTARLWNLDSCSDSTRLKHTGLVWGVAFSPDGNHLATACSDGTARIWESNTGTAIADLIHGDEVNSVAFSPDGSQLLTACDDATARIWNVVTGIEDARLDHYGAVWQACFSPDGLRVATVSNDDTVRLWETGTGLEISCLIPGGQVNAVAFSSDGARLATGGSDHAVRIWDLSTGLVISDLAYEHAVNGLTFSTDGNMLAIICNQVVHVWDANAEVEIVQLEHPSEVWGVAFSSDSTHLATGSSDRAARIWDLSTGADIIYTIHDDQVNCVAFSPDGAHLATASLDGTACIWWVMPQAAAHEALALLPRNLTAEEWSQYLPSADFRKLRPDVG